MVPTQYIVKKEQDFLLMLSLSLVLITFYIFLDPVTEYVNKPKFSTLMPKKKKKYVCGGGGGKVLYTA